jgi:hypothetical protein
LRPATDGFYTNDVQVRKVTCDAAQEHMFFEKKNGTGQKVFGVRHIMHAVTPAFAF